MGKSRRSRKKKKSEGNQDRDAAVTDKIRDKDGEVSENSGEKRKHTVSEFLNAPPSAKRPKQQGMSECCSYFAHFEAGLVAFLQRVSVNICARWKHFEGQNAIQICSKLRV